MGNTFMTTYDIKSKICRQLFKNNMPTWITSKETRQCHAAQISFNVIIIMWKSVVS